MTTNRSAKRDAMYARIHQHGLTLLDIFPNATERDPVKLCKKLRTIEGKAHRAAEAYCNGTITEDEIDAASGAARAAVIRLLGITTEQAKETGLRTNLDPRGYILKLSDAWTSGWNSTASRRLYTDCGGYGILAPDLSND